MAEPARKRDPDLNDVMDAIGDLGRRVDARLEKVEAEQKRLGEAATKTQIDVAEMKGRFEGRFTGIEGRLSGMDARFTGIENQLRQVPTIWTLAALIIAIFGFAFVLLRFAVPHP